MLSKKQILYLLILSTAAILMPVQARLTLTEVGFAAFGGMFVPIALLLRNGIHTFMWPLEGFNPFSGTSSEDSVLFKKLNLAVELGSFIIFLIIVKFL